MRYTLDSKKNKVYPVLSIVVDGDVIINPTDEMIDENEAGCKLVEVPATEVSDDEHYLTHRYRLDGNTIYSEWVEQEKTPQMLMAWYKTQIDHLNEESTRFKNDGLIEYQGSNYIPRWVFEFYDPMLNLNQMTPMFPCEIAAADGSSKMFTYEEFLSLYAHIAGVYALYIRDVNSQIATLNSKIELLSST